MQKRGDSQQKQDQRDRRAEAQCERSSHEALERIMRNMILSYKKYERHDMVMGTGQGH